MRDWRGCRLSCSCSFCTDVLDLSASAALSHDAELDWGSRCNVDMLMLIQLGLTFANAEGDLPQCNGEMCVWQFNFRSVHCSSA